MNQSDLWPYQQNCVHPDCKGKDVCVLNEGSSDE